MKTTLGFVIATFALFGTTIANAGEGLAATDTSGDGLVSLEEMKAAHSAKIEARFAHMDTNTDGLLSEDEIEQARKERRHDRRERHKNFHRNRRNPERMIERLDTDGSGSVSLSELSAKRDDPDTVAFQNADADGSGELNASEIKAWIKATRAERRRARESTEE